jgi:hypothetical protein
LRAAANLTVTARRLSLVSDNSLLKVKSGFWMEPV